LKYLEYPFMVKQKEEKKTDSSMIYQRKKE